MFFRFWKVVCKNKQSPTILLCGEHWGGKGQIVTRKQINKIITDYKNCCVEVSFLLESEG